MSIPPKRSTAYFMALETWSSNRMSHWIPRALPPAASISAQAVWIVPGSLGWGVTVLASITTLAPSCAALLPIAKPIPYLFIYILRYSFTLLAPVIKTVLPLRFPTDSKEWSEVNNFITQGNWPNDVSLHESWELMTHNLSINFNINNFFFLSIRLIHIENLIHWMPWFLVIWSTKCFF